jgi:hypothetical protein
VFAKHGRLADLFRIYEGEKHMIDRPWWRVPVVAAGVVLSALAGASDARAQGCMATRVSPPMFGASGEGRYLRAGQWETSLVGRHYSARRHFYDQNVESHNPAPKVEKTIGDLSLTRMLSDRYSLTLSVPYSDGTFDRTPIAPTAAVDNASGIGDVAVVVRRWMSDPATSKNGNIRLGVGLKAPTGAYTQETNRTRNGLPAPGHADISIQPGDGGWGGVLGLEAFRHTGARGVLFAEAAYILNPRGDSGHNNQMLGPGPYVPNNRTSVPDYYLARAGFVVGEPVGLKRASAQVGLRLEGQPVRDILGPDTGFRRPGHTLALEPGVAYAFGRSNVFVSVPLTIYRGRPLSVDEEKRASTNAAQSNPPGARTSAVSAAFADVNVIVGVTFRLK